MIPASARAIVDARRQGKKPADMVIISLVGRINEPNPTVYVFGPEHDWWWVIGLDIMVYADKRSKFREVLEEIAKCKPKYLGLWDVEHKEGSDVYYFPTAATIDRPATKWVWKLDFLPWMDFQNRNFACD